MSFHPQMEQILLLNEVMRTVLVPTDFSQSCEVAMTRAVRLPFEADAKLVLLHVMPGEDHRADAEVSLLRAGELARRVPNLRVEYDLTIGDPSYQIAARARVHDAQLIVLGRHGRRRLREAITGTHADRTLRVGDTPVLVVNQPAVEPYRRPIIATDFEAGAEHLAELALDVLEDEVDHIHVVHAYDIPFEGQHTIWRKERLAEELEAESIRQMAELLESLGRIRVRCDTTVRRGDARTVILDEIESRDADLAVLGTHARTGVSHLVHVSTADRVLDAARCDVLLLPPSLVYRSAPRRQRTLATGVRGAR